MPEAVVQGAGADGLVTPVRIEGVFDDPGFIRGLVQRNGPYRTMVSYLPASAVRGGRPAAGDGVPAHFRATWAAGGCPLADGAEVILGARRDEVFGLVYLVGHGGLGTEATADTAVLLPAVTRPEFTAALAGLRTPVRTRSGSEIDDEALWQAFDALAELAACNPKITDAELNPVIVGPPGTGAVGVDAVIRCRGSA